MKTLKISLIGLLAIASAFAQQNTLGQTTITAAASATQTYIVVASATGINAPTATVPASSLYIVDVGQVKGDKVAVISVTGTTIGIRRSGQGTAHASGALVLVAATANLFASSDPVGSCVTANTFVTPVLNVVTGNQWLCSSVTGTWVPGFSNNIAEPAATAAVASAAGVILPSGQFQHLTGTAAITGLTIPVGYNGGPICFIPDGIATTTTAGNIALASTTVVGKVLCFSYDAKAAKPFFPSY